MYIDKTAYLEKLIRLRQPIFLSRPRRFGKSLFVSMAKSYFEGRKDLFDGLSISRGEKDWTAYPVIHLDLSDGDFTNPVSAKEALRDFLEPYEREFNVPNEGLQSFGTRLRRIIRKANEVTGRKVVILIDEYDYPLLENYRTEEGGDELRAIFGDLYSCLKPNLPFIQFLFITGVTKFLISRLDNLNDISLNPEFEGICGITGSELMGEFVPDISDLAEKLHMGYEQTLGELKSQYDGYHFSRNLTDIYNPFSLLGALQAKEIAPYWFGSATPSFLLRLFEDRRIDIGKDIEGVVLDAEDLDIPPFESRSVVPLLCQTGYLTIKNWDKPSNRFTLGFPNNEVRRGLSSSGICIIN